MNIFEASSGTGSGSGSTESDSGTLVIKKEKTKRPKKYKVLLHNDDYTTMEFVIQILQKVFHKSYEESYSIMMNVHLNGVGVCGIYSYEVAETKQNEVKRLSREHGHPLRCTLESE